MNVLMEFTSMIFILFGELLLMFVSCVLSPDFGCKPFRKNMMKRP